MDYYREVLQTPMSFSIKYYIILALLVSLVTTGAASARLLPKLQPELNNLVSQVQNYYPDELVLTMTDGKLSINKDEPYVIPLPKSLTENQNDTQPDDGTTEMLPENLVVLDSQGTIDNLETYNTLILINSANVLYRDQNGKIEVYPLKDMPNGQFTKQNFNELVDKVKSFLVYLPALIISFMLVTLFIVNMTFRLVYLLLVALLLMFWGKSKMADYNYAKYYKIAIHTVTLPTIIATLLDIVAIPFNIPFWFIALNTVMGILVINKITAPDVPTEVKKLEQQPNQQ